jgi:HK97 family phage portal protein
MKLKKPPNRVQALILSLLGMELGAAIEGLPPPDEGGQVVSHNSVLSLSAAWACTRLISETIATLPLSIYETTSAGKRIASQHPLQFVLHSQPNPDCTASVFWEAVIAAMLLRGNAYIEKLKLGDRVVGLNFLHPDCLTVRIGPNGGRIVKVRGPDGTVRDIPRDRLWVIPGFSLDGKTGVSVIRYGSMVFGTALAAQRASKSTFDRGLHQTTALKMPGTLREDQRDQAREALGKLSGAVNAGRSVILEAGTDIATVGILPVDAQMLETLNHGVEEVCRWFRTDPSLVGHGSKDSNWGTGLEQKMIGFLTFTLSPLIRRIEEGINKELLGPGRFYAKYAVEGLLRADSAARAAFYSVMVNNGIFTRDEVRALEDREPMGGNAAVLTVQTALAPLDKIGQADDSAQARAALMNWLREPATPAQG